jgi:TetR/AcrR family transcriptional regulator
MAPSRRFGSETSSSRGQLLKAAAVVMANEGYAAVTSRRVAEEAGLNRALVHYYFHTMDDLFLALFRHRAAQGLAAQAEALTSAQPLWALWDLYRDTEGTALTAEFVALSNHRKAIRAEIAAAVERFRAEELTVLAGAFDRHGVAQDDISPAVAAILLASVTRFLAAEATLGMSDGHAETVAFVERLIRRLEGDRHP